MSNTVPKSAFDFLNTLKKNNNREWFAEHKNDFKTEEAKMKTFFEYINGSLSEIDHIQSMKVFRIYRDIRFSKDKTPYKTHFAASFTRVKPQLRGGYYLQLKPSSSFIAGGFWNPNKEDLYRIRKEFEADDTEIRKIISAPNFIHHFGALEGEELKTAPKGFDKEDPAIDLIKKKTFVVTKNFTDKDVLGNNFSDQVIETFAAMRPYFDYMTDVLTTDLNGQSLL